MIHSQNQVNELVLGLHDYRLAVLREFSYMREVELEHIQDETKKLKMGPESSAPSAADLLNVAEYLAPRLLGVLGFLDSKLVSSSTMYK